MGSRRKLPIGIQTFRTLREEGCYYVDKTAHVERLIEEGAHYFLSRPRRFGKSLFLDTLKELFEGNEALFEGLAIHGRRDWSMRHPVLRLSFGTGDFKQPGFLEASFMEKLAAAEAEAQVVTDYSTAPGRFAALLAALHRRTGQRVVVLVDEYDKPILDALAVPDMARANRDFLRGVYSVVKDSDAHVRFTFITGVSKFSKVSLFSGLNNLKDITLNPRYSAICGYTDADLDTVFAPELPGLDRDEIRRWYNGYGWLGEERVYNPFDILLLFDTREFAAHWFRTGTPTFLVETLVRRGVSPPALERMAGTDDLLSTFDVDDMATEALLFQTGYLTIVEHKRLGGRTVYRLGYPNQEVRQSLNDSLSRYLSGDATRQMANSIRLYELLEANDFAGLKALFHAFYASIPHQWYTNNDIANFEGYYASVFYSYFAGLGLDVTVEDSSSHGRLDMAVLFNANVYLFEFKVVELEPAGEAAPRSTAMAQLKERGYADKYRHLGQPIHLVAVEFSKEARNVVAFEVERAAYQPDVALHFARQMRGARARVQADAEGYVAVAIAVEQLAAALGAKGGACAAWKVIVDTLNGDWTHGDGGAPSLGSAYYRVRRARNIAVHEGAMSRAVATHAIDLTIGLEIALMKAVNTDAARAWMVPDPTVAHPWMTVAQVRSALLAGGFSALPIWWEDACAWHLVRDIDVVAYLIQAGGDLAKTKARLQDVVVGKGAVPELHLQRAPLVIPPEANVKTLGEAGWKSEVLALVVCGDDPKRLLGVLTPHDLLTR